MIHAYISLCQSNIINTATPAEWLLSRNHSIFPPVVVVVISRKEEQGGDVQHDKKVTKL